MAPFHRTNRAGWKLWLVNAWLAAVLVFFVFSRLSSSGFVHHRRVARSAAAAPVANTPVAVRTEGAPARRP